MMRTIPSNSPNSRHLQSGHHARALRIGALMLGLALTQSGCAVATVAGAAAGAAISVTGAVVSTGVSMAGKVVEKTVDLVTPSKD
jgi:hypothetical protein